MLFVQIKMSDYFRLPNRGLEGYLRRVEEGYPHEIRTTWFKGRSVTGLLHDWMGHLKPLKTLWPSLYDFEVDLSAKVGPMSIMKPLNERLDDIKSYFDSILLESTPIPEEAIAQAMQEWQALRGLTTRSRQATIDNMRLSTNSGSPYFTKRSTLVAGNMDYSVPDVLGGQWHYSLDAKGTMSQKISRRNCAVIGWRGQEGGPEPDDVKQRVVWMFPFAVNIEELRVYQPLIAAMQHTRRDRFSDVPYVPAWKGLRPVELCVSHMFDTKEKNQLVVCTDFSKFDQHFNSSMAVCARTMLNHLLTPGSETDYWLDQIFPIKYTLPLCIAWESFAVGRHGMGSGSGGTNPDETLAHRTLQYEAAWRDRSKLNIFSQCLGDDGCLTYPGISVESVVNTYTKHGQEMNLTKQYASPDDLVYLRRWYHKEYRDDANVCLGVYSTCRALGRLAEQERYIDPKKWSEKMVALRQLSILENVKNHPLREQFVDWSIKGDKYSFGLDIPGFMDNLEREVHKAKAQIPDFLGYTRALELENNKSIGINDWWIVRYLKSKA